jgi:hypothetical protein
VQQLSRTLRQRGGFHQEHVLEMIDAASDPRYRPARANIMRELSAWLETIGPEDDVLVYFSGHGFVGPDGESYLAPVDCDPRHPDATAISLEWLCGQIARSKAKSKMLIIDTTSGDLSVLERTEGLIILASSAAHEYSLVWSEVQQSLFSYWLNQGLQGHADRDMDNAVTIDELYEYLHRTVTASAETVFGKSQTPVRVIGPNVAGAPVVVFLEPHTLRLALESMAGELATAIRLKQLSLVAFTEFIAGSTDRDAALPLASDFGVLGRYCAEELERRVREKLSPSEGTSVLPQEALRRLMSESAYSVEDLRSGAIGTLDVEGKELQAIAVGRFSLRTGRVFTLECDLISTETLEKIGIASGTALINDSEWAMLGLSIAVKPEDFPPPPAPSPDQPTPAGAATGTLIQTLDERAARMPHPLFDSEFPFPVKILVDGREQPLVFRGNEAFVSLRKDETYAVRVENKTDDPVFMRLLVDGLNTLPEKVAVGEATEGTAGRYEYRPAQRVKLDEAVPWMLSGRGVFAVKGFYSHTGATAEYREFRVADASPSLAAARRPADQIGLITAAFYATAETRGLIGTGYGERREKAAEVYRNEVVGRLLAVVHIRYVEPEALDEVLEAAAP